MASSTCSCYSTSHGDRYNIRNMEYLRSFPSSERVAYLRQRVCVAKRRCISSWKGVRDTFGNAPAAVYPRYDRINAHRFAYWHKAIVEDVHALRDFSTRDWAAFPDEVETAGAWKLPREEKCKPEPRGFSTGAPPSAFEEEQGFNHRTLADVVRGVRCLDSGLKKDGKIEGLSRISG